MRFGVLALFCLQPLLGEEKAAEPAVEKVPADLAEKIRNIFPHITIDMENRCVDVEAVITLTDGFLELIACIKDTKEHESLIMVEAKPRHIHAALLLIGAKAGNPAERKPLDEQGSRWIDIPPRGQPMKVTLVYTKEGGEKVERPIRDFIAPTDNRNGLPVPEGEKEIFPDTFLFVGSINHGEGKEMKYLADDSGHVLSISTFGDELLSLPGILAQDNGSLSWCAKPETVPQVGTKVILRIRPQWADQ
jgi:hypothetical protein